MEKFYNFILAILLVALASQLAGIAACVYHSVEINGIRYYDPDIKTFTFNAIFLAFL